MSSKSELKRLCTINPIGMAERIHLLERQLEEAEQRIAESQRQEPVAWMAHIPQAGGTYSVHLQEEKHHPLGVAWQEALYRAPIVPPTIEEAVKKENERCVRIIQAQDVDPSFKNRLADAIRARSGK